MTKANLMIMYKSKLRLLEYYENEKKNNIADSMIKKTKKEIAKIEKELAKLRREEMRDYI